MAGASDAVPSKKSFTGVQSPRPLKAFCSNELRKAFSSAHYWNQGRCYAGARPEENSRILVARPPRSRNPFRHLAPARSSRPLIPPAASQPPPERSQAAPETHPPADPPHRKPGESRGPRETLAEGLGGDRGRVCPPIRPRLPAGERRGSSLCPAIRQRHRESSTCDPRPPGLAIAERKHRPSPCPPT